MADAHPPPSTGEDWLEADVTRRLFARRELLLSGPLDTARATRFAAELMALEAEGFEPVTVSIHSTGGALPALFTVTDTMHAMHAPVDTVCLGQTCGSAVALVAAGTGQRRAGRHAQLTLRLPETDVSGSAVDIDRAAHEHTMLNEQLFDLLARATQRPRERVAHEWQHGRVLSAHEAMTEGLVDEVA